MKIAEATRRIAELETQLTDERGKLKRICDDHAKLMQENSKRMADGFENQKHDKLLRVIGHITAGRSNEAVQELLEPLPVVLSFEVRYADDKTREAAEDEMLKRIVGIAHAAPREVSQEAPEL